MYTYVYQTEKGSHLELRRVGRRACRSQGAPPFFFRELMDAIATIGVERGT